MKVKVTGYHARLYQESIKAFFVATFEPFQKKKHEDAVKQFEKDHHHWLLTDPVGRQELKKRREAAEDRRHKDYLTCVGRSINAFSNQERAKKGLPARNFKPLFPY